MEASLSMPKYIVFLILILIYANHSIAQNQVYGVWQLEQTYCVNPQTQRAYMTRIMKMPWLGFEPKVRLNFYESDGKQYLQKEVVEASCSASSANSGAFIKATHEIEISTHNFRGQIIHGMKAKRILAATINNEALKKCGSPMNGYILNSLTDLKYPEYFQQEARRAYNISIKDDRMYLIFSEPDICKDFNTVMIFKKRDPKNRSAPSKMILR